MKTDTDIIASKPYSNHQDDSHLSIVLHRNFKGELVTHMYNSQDGGYYHGHYHGQDMEQAINDFNERGVANAQWY
jgi:hypothetical protein